MVDNNNGAVTETENPPKLSPMEVKRAWGDEEDVVVEESTSSVSDEKPIELNLDSLVTEENKKVNKFLDEPEDSNIKAIRICLSICLFLFLVLFYFYLFVVLIC